MNSRFLSPWRQANSQPSLVESYKSVPVYKEGAGVWRKFIAFLGPGYIVAVGYMDPGNWATSLAGGSQFGFTLLCVALLSNLIAIVLQSLCSRLGIGAGRDLAQACRDGSPKFLVWPQWLLAEIAICATDLAEVIGTAIGLMLVFHIPLEIGVVITALDVFLILWLQNKGFRYIEIFVITLLGVIASCFLIQIAMADPNWNLVFTGLRPTTAIFKNSEMLYLSLGIIGATVMPHNLYLHSSIVQTRAYGESVAEKRQALKYATIDTVLALCFAFAINASILILAGTFHYSGMGRVDDLSRAHALLEPMLGSGLAPTLFGIALLCCGLNSTVTATMSGQIVMEGFINIRVAAWLRRLITRCVAIVPAAFVTIYYGANETGKLLIFSQVVLSLQLPFAIVPLVMFTASRAKMGPLVSPRWLTFLGAAIAVLLIILNLKMILDLGSAAFSGSGGQ